MSHECRDIPVHSPSVNNNTSHNVNSLPIDVHRHSFTPLPLEIGSPINIDILRGYLTHHPNHTLVQYVIQGFTYGFDIGFSGPITEGSTRNLLSARNNPEAVATAIFKEVHRGHTSGPFTQPPFPILHCSPLGAVPKKDNSHRLILDLSSPKGTSVNEGIPPETFSVTYSSFDDAVTLVSTLGPDAHMAKMDIRHAFRLCPVRPEDWCLLGHSINNEFFVDTRLPFGSRSSPYIFNLFADLLLWILINCFAIPYALHYLDDFFFCARNKLHCKQYIDSATEAFNRLGVPLAPEKLEGPSQILTYLGIEINVKTRTIQLPKDKYQALITALQVLEKSEKVHKTRIVIFDRDIIICM